MDHKQEIINNFEKKVKEEIENIDNVTDDHEKFCKLDTLYKIHKYLSNFDEVEPVLKKFFEEKAQKDKWER